MADKLKLMLVDDHYLVRMGLASIMALEPDVVVCAEASSGEQARALFRSHRPDVTLMDLRLPDVSGTETLQAGAMAYLVKSVQRDELMRAIRKAAQGQRHIPAEVASRLAERMTRTQLSTRELEVLRLLVAGRRNREIATTLDITEGTVKLHVSSILSKLGVADRTEAVTRALQRGIVQLDM